MNEKDVIKGALANTIGLLITLFDFQIVKAAFHELSADQKMWTTVQGRLKKGGIEGDPLPHLIEENQPKPTGAKHAESAYVAGQPYWRED